MKYIYILLTEEFFSENECHDDQDESVPKVDMKVYERKTLYVF